MNLKFYKLRAIFLLFILKFLTKILFVEMPPIFSVTGLIEKDGKILFLDLSYSKGLGIPGGIVRENETLEEALKREIFEETGLTIKNYKYFASIKSSYHGVPSNSAVFLVEVSGKTKNSEEGKLVWMKPEEALDKLFYESNRKTIKIFLEKK